MSNFVIKDSGERTEFQTGCVRDLQGGKGRFDLLGTEGLIRIHLSLHGIHKKFENLGTEGLFRLAKWYEMGAKKYEDRNWEKGMQIGVCFNSGMRHLTKFAAGWKDEDHLAACAWNLFAMMEYESTHPELQDLPKVNGLSSEKNLEKIMDEKHIVYNSSLIIDQIASDFDKTSNHYSAAQLCMALYGAGWKGIDFLAIAAFHVFRIMEIECRHPHLMNMACELDNIDYSEG